MRRFLPLRKAARMSSGTWIAGRLWANQSGRKISVTEPLPVPRESARWVRGQWNPFAAKIRLSPPTTAAATATLRSERFAHPV